MKLFGINEICLLLCRLHCIIIFMDCLMTITSMPISDFVAGFYFNNALNSLMAFIWLLFLVFVRLAFVRFCYNP